MKDSAIEQILLHLYNCIDEGFSYRAKKGLFIDDLFPSGWKNFSKEEIKESINGLKKSKLITKKKEYDGSVIVLLTEKGKLRALNIRFKLLNYKKEIWDKKWRMVAFDIPNTHRKRRDAIRYRLRIAGFYELQESIFIYPYDCESEIRDFITLFKLEKYIRFALLDFIDGEDYLIKLFKLA
ncbi:MAG: phenylacetic acid degradation operon negative regulatory protein [Parcubacteria group bacterium Licking1014_1]|nr:MAG: phenylacetic acid degradation operon negative regulatory protein [Parcubacteria group bacterium Licking1014_1]